MDKIYSRSKGSPKGSKTHALTTSQKTNTSVSFNQRIKEMLANMPSNVNTKKEVDDYYKNAMKNISKAMKEEKSEVKKGKR